MLEVKNVRFAYQADAAFCFNLSVDIGEIVVVEGASGAGKSTLLGLIAGFLQPSSGDIYWNNQRLNHLEPSLRPLSMIFQDDNLFGHLTCRMNIALGLSPSLRLGDDAWQRVDAAMEKLGIAELADRLPQETSGGQQQRVALARGLARANMGANVAGNCQDRNLLLFDEPFSALDPETRQDCIKAVLELMKAGQFAAVVVSHDPSDALALKARRIRI